MKWRQGNGQSAINDEYWIESPEGYKVCKVNIGEQVIYAASAPDRTPLLTAPDPSGGQACKEACQRHYEEHHGNNEGREAASKSREPQEA